MQEAVCLEIGVIGTGSGMTPMHFLSTVDLGVMMIPSGEV
jgi:hypothetical protein